MARTLVLTSDPHLTHKYPFSTSPNPFKDTFFCRAFSGALQPIKYAIEHDCDIINGGDWFDKEKIHSPEFNITNILFKRVQNSFDTKMIINLGNHEIDYAQAVPSVLEVEADNYSSIKTASINHPWSIHGVRGIYVYVIPYCIIESDFNKRLSDLCNSGLLRPAALCIHQNIKGIQLGKTKSIDGIDTSDMMAKIQGKFKFVVCGHLHHPRVIDKFGVPVIIPGTTMSVDFRDEGSEKVFYTIDLSNNGDVVNIDSHRITQQVIFKTIDMNSFETKITKDHFYKVRYRQSQYSDYQKFCNTHEKNLLGVVPEIIAERDKLDLSLYAKPMDKTTDDWFNEFGSRREEEEIIAGALIENKRLFG